MKPKRNQDVVEKKIDCLIEMANHYIEDRIWLIRDKFGRYWLASEQRGAFELLGNEYDELPNVIAQWFVNR